MDLPGLTCLEGKPNVLRLRRGSFRRCWKCLDKSGSLRYTIQKKKDGERIEYIMRNIGGRIVGRAVMYRGCGTAVLTGFSGRAEAVLRLSSESADGVEVFLTDFKVAQIPLKTKSDVVTFVDSVVHAYSPCLSVHSGDSNDDMSVNMFNFEERAMQTFRGKSKSIPNTGGGPDPSTVTLLFTATRHLTKHRCDPCRPGDSLSEQWSGGEYPGVAY
uniref:Uncharacterized protein n=1 Tax=Rhodosorus marinus TaxID=101924 RepID=A0A7S3EC14_9RHOD|mmetsp:Transcript_21675/g.88405  ORF Transcript_21675/g.88405 Transcript_21675/m.88405 type:complete len:215 (+) Transcript_21675:125-769(+)